MTDSSVDSERCVVRLDTKGFCIFCLKRNGSSFAGPTAVYDDGDKSVYVHECKIDVKELEAGSRLRHQFGKVISSYLETNFTCLKANSSQNDQHSLDEQSEHDLNKRFDAGLEVDVGYICQDCSYLVEKICKLYHEMKKIELEVDWKVRQLKHIAAFAMRAPTRLKVFREKFNNSGDCKDKDDLARIEMFRKELLEKCSLKLKKAQPRIVLKRSRKSLSSSESKKAKLSQRKDIVFSNVEVQTDWVAVGEMIDIDPTHLSSFTSPSSGTHANDKGLQEDDSTCQFRIRPIQSLTSPSKSVTPIKSKSDGKNEKIEVVQLHNGNAMNSLHSSSGKFGNVDVIWNNKELGNNRTSLTEWLQSTFKCDQCKKIFISEATLNVHKMTCKVEATENDRISSTTRINDENESNEDAIDNAPSFGDDSSNEDGGDNSGNIDKDVEEITDESLSSAPNTRTCTIRILRKTPELVARPPGTRFCKYCSTNIRCNHFSRHRITMKHKLNKRQHKRAKKLGIAGASTNGNGIDQNSVLDADNDKNVKVVKIIYVTKSGTQGESPNITDNIDTATQSIATEDNGVEKRGTDKGLAQVHTEVYDNDNNEVIDISD